MLGSSQVGPSVSWRGSTRSSRIATSTTSWGPQYGDELVEPAEQPRAGSPAHECWLTCCSVGSLALGHPFAAEMVGTAGRRERRLEAKCVRRIADR